MVRKIPIDSLVNARVFIRSPVHCVRVCMCVDSSREKGLRGKRRNVISTRAVREKPRGCGRIEIIDFGTGGFDSALRKSSDIIIPRRKSPKRTGERKMEQRGGRERDRLSGGGRGRGRRARAACR